MAGSLFYSVPTIDHDDDDDDDDDNKDDTDDQGYDPRRRSDNSQGRSRNESYLPHYASDSDSDDRDHSDSSTQSPPMSLFLDRTHQHIEDDDDSPLVSKWPCFRKSESMEAQFSQKSALKE